MCVWSALTSSTRTLAVAFLQHRDVHYLRLCQPQSCASRNIASHDFT